MISNPTSPSKVPTYFRDSNRPTQPNGSMTTIQKTNTRSNPTLAKSSNSSGLQYSSTKSISNLSILHNNPLFKLAKQRRFDDIVQILEMYSDDEIRVWLYCCTGDDNQSISSGLGRSKSKKCLDSFKGETPLHAIMPFRPTENVVEMMIRRITDTDEGQSPENQTDMQGRTPLHVAASEGCDLSVVKRLLQNSNAVQVQDVMGRCPLHLACANPKGTVMSRQSSSRMFTSTNSKHDEQNMMEIIATLCWTYPDAVSMKDMDGQTPIDIARLNKASSMTIGLLNSISNMGHVNGTNQSSNVSTNGERAVSKRAESPALSYVTPYNTGSCRSRSNSPRKRVESMQNKIPLRSASPRKRQDNIFSSSNSAAGGSTAGSSVSYCGNSTGKGSGQGQSPQQEQQEITYISPLVHKKKPVNCGSTVQTQDLTEDAASSFNDLSNFSAIEYSNNKSPRSTVGGRTVTSAPSPGGWTVSSSSGQQHRSQTSKSTISSPQQRQPQHHNQRQQQQRLSSPTKEFVRSNETEMTIPPLAKSSDMKRSRALPLIPLYDPRREEIVKDDALQAAMARAKARASHANCGDDNKNNNPISGRHKSVDYEEEEEDDDDEVDDSLKDLPSIFIKAGIDHDDDDDCSSIGCFSVNMMMVQKRLEELRQTVELNDDEFEQLEAEIDENTSKFTSTEDDKYDEPTTMISKQKQKQHQVSSNNENEYPQSPTKESSSLFTGGKSTDTKSPASITSSARKKAKPKKTGRFEDIPDHVRMEI